MNITLSHSVKLNIRGFREMCLRVLYQKIDKMFKMLQLYKSMFMIKQKKHKD